MADTSSLRELVRDIPDWPRPGIMFRDITPLLASPAAFQETIRRFAEHYRGQKIDAVVAAEARGFILAAPLAIQLSAGFVPIRKPGKLPGVADAQLMKRVTREADYSEWTKEFLS